MSSRSEKKIPLIVQLLVLSVALNVGLVVSFCVKAYQAPKMKVVQELASQTVRKAHIKNITLLKDYFQYSFYQLVDELGDDTLVEDGLCKRDLALSCLVDFHYFDLTRCLSGFEIQQRKMPFVQSEGKEEVSFTLFPGLNSAHFKGIMAFIKQEKWPYVPEGLFIELVKQKDPDFTLFDAFIHTDHFLLVQKLFSRSGEEIDDHHLVELLRQGEWSFLDRFFQSQMRSVDLSPRVFETFIVQYLHYRSPLMAQFVLDIGREDMIRRMDDRLLIQMINVLEENSEKTEQFLKNMLISVRSDEVRKAAALKLFAFSGELPPAPYDHFLSLKRFTSYEIKKEGDVSLRAALNEHTVKAGESLWVIARKYGVTIDDVVNANELSSRHRLKIGMKLVIP